MKLTLKSGKSYEITRYEETWADSMVSRTMVFAEDNTPEDLYAALTDEELVSSTVSRAGKEIQLPSLSVQSINRVVSDSSESVAGVFIEK